MFAGIAQPGELKGRGPYRTGSLPQISKYRPPHLHDITGANPMRNLLLMNVGLIALLGSLAQPLPA